MRRWLVWAAVTVATIAVGSAAWSPLQRWHYRIAAGATLGLVLVLGTLATLDLFDAGVRLPWMGDRPWPAELVGGFAGAVVIPLLLGLTWGRFRVAGAISGVALALLLHVSVALLLLTGLYQAVEALVRRAPWPPRWWPARSASPRWRSWPVRRRVAARSVWLQPPSASGSRVVAGS